MTLDLSPLLKAVDRLEEGYTRHEADPADIQLRDGLIQRFEFTYELAHKFIKRYLEDAAATPEEYDTADFQHLIRSASEQGLIRGEWADWRRYREMRAKTSHTYDEEVAREVVGGIPQFLDELRFLRDELKRRLR